MKIPFTAVFVLLLAPAVHAQFSVNAWKGNLSSGIVEDSLWAVHFGSATNTTIAGKAVTGVAGANPSVAGNFSISGVPFVYNNDNNALTALGSNGSAIIAHDFIYGGDPGIITLEGLTVGKTYVASILSTSWGSDIGQLANFRAITFTSGADILLVDQDQFGYNPQNLGKGIRVDYAFTATEVTRVISLGVSNANAATWHLYGLALRGTNTVVTTAADSGAGSLRDFIEKAPSGATITFAPELAGSTISITSELSINKDLTIAGGPGITLDGGGTNRILSVISGKTVALRNLTLQHGSLFTPGGAILNKGLLTLTQCTLVGNSGDSGGAIQCTGGTLLLENCTLSGNTATGSSGGAIRNNDGSVALVQCTLTGNAALYGGAIFNVSGSLKLYQCTVTGNDTSDFGGAIDCDSSLSIYNSIVAGNTSPTDGGDIINHSQSSFVHLGANIIQDYVIETGGLQSGQAIINAAPTLAPLGNYGGPTQTMPPLPGSPALDAGLNQYAYDAEQIALSTDQRGAGYTRLFDADADGSSVVDIGAAESAPEISIKQSAVNLSDGWNTTRFGNVKIRKTSVAKTFVITNNGTLDLTKIAVSKDGANKSEFFIAALGQNSLAPGTSTTFTVTFKPKATGKRAAAIHVKSNDADENPFDIKTAGTGKAQ
ncbi:MAG: choice-of-anchor D domain-containing protein [Luteolibacter sp.]|uniref:choice-of-anchor D domain-containing protein n=1 Tax=Luteolibacter sp. TaxID=1962973 RepID=UPI00326640E8